MKTIIFLSGFALPNIISKSSLFFDRNFWSNYNTIFYKSKIPISDSMVNQEIESLTKLTNQYVVNDLVVVGHSLGAWWAANLACNPDFKANKLALWTPLGIANMFPIFLSSNKSEPLFKTPNINNIGINNTTVIYAKYDLIVPYQQHALPLIKMFKADSLCLNGGHAWQLDHKYGLTYLKNWINII